MALAGLASLCLGIALLFFGGRMARALALVSLLSLALLLLLCLYFRPRAGDYIDSRSHWDERFGWRSLLGTVVGDLFEDADLRAVALGRLVAVARLEGRTGEEHEGFGSVEPPVGVGRPGGRDPLEHCRRARHRQRLAYHRAVLAKLENTPATLSSDG